MSINAVVCTNSFWLAYVIGVQIDSDNGGCTFESNLSRTGTGTGTSANFARVKTNLVPLLRVTAAKRTTKHHTTQQNIHHSLSPSSSVCYHHNKHHWNRLLRRLLLTSLSKLFIFIFYLPLCFWPLLSLAVSDWLIDSLSDKSDFVFFWIQPDHRITGFQIPIFSDVGIFFFESI